MPSSGRYQSRLFNFVHQRSRRLIENLRGASRHLQVSVNWGVQLLLYPVYLLFQSKRAAGKQLDQNMQQSWLQLPADDTNSPQTPPTADTPIQQVLLLLDALPSEEAVSTPFPSKRPLNFLAFLASNALTRFASLGRFKFFPNSPIVPLLPERSDPPNSPNHNRPAVRGIATQLSSRTLVLVTTQNKILDIFTPQQQQKLQERIIEEVAGYWHCQRLAYSNGQHIKRLSVHTQTESANPAHLFSGMTAFVSNLFQSSLVRNQKPELSVPFSSRTPTGNEKDLGLHSHQALVVLDRTIANLESNLAPVSEVAITLGQRSRQLVWRVQTQSIKLLSSQPTNSPEAHTLQLQALIWAAINYFFGHSRGKQLEQTTPKTKSRRKPLPQHGPASSKLLSRQASPQLVSDPWLTEGDLFGESELESEPLTVREPAAKSEGSSLPLKNLFSRFQRLPQLRQASGLLKRQNTTAGKATDVSQQLSLFPKLSRSERAGESSNQPCTQSTQLKSAPDWIETNATLMGYVKHPLEQLLAWLDRAMLWLEDVLMKVWRWMQQL